MTNKILQKIRSIIYQQREGNLTKEQAYESILNVVYIYQSEKLLKRL